MFPVVKLCEKQLRDVNKDDILCNGLYRRCNIYKGGGGYDRFVGIWDSRTGKRSTGLNDQFVVQLYGCPLNCPYCYVTRDGVFGDVIKVTAGQLVKDFVESGCKVFHLMGGAPDLYIDKWYEIIELLPEGTVFHSDLLCQGIEYNYLNRLAEYKNTLYALSIKGATPEEFYENTRTKFDSALFWKNFSNLVFFKVPFYITFTGMPEESIELFKSQVREIFPNEADSILADSFSIDLVHYKALD